MLKSKDGSWNRLGVAKLSQKKRLSKECCIAIFQSSFLLSQILHSLVTWNESIDVNYVNFVPNICVSHWFLHIFEAPGPHKFFLPIFFPSLIDINVKNQSSFLNFTWMQIPLVQKARPKDSQKRIICKKVFKILTFAQRLLTEQIPHQACAKSSKEDLMQMPQNFNFADSGKLWGEKELTRNQFLIWRMLHIVTQLY